VKRCAEVAYEVVIRDASGKEIDGKPFKTESADIWLGLKPHWLK
jgi:hypothetical protein